MNLTRTGIAIFVLGVLAGPLYTVPGYTTTGNLISELAAQNTPNNFLMSGAFIALGLAVVVDGLRPYRRALAPFVTFGFIMALLGLFGHKPINPTVPYAAWVHTTHGVLATVAGISITVAFIWQAVRQSLAAMRILAAALAVLCFALPLAILAWPEFQGAIQRFMYLFVFSWLWLFYPQKTYD